MDNTIKRSAYHESGHAVMGFFVGYNINRIEVASTGDGVTEIDYAEDLLLCTALLNLSEPEIINSLPSQTKQNIPVTADKLIYVLTGGPIAEALFIQGFDFVGQLEIELSGPDLIRCESIDSFLAHYLPEHPINSLEGMLKKASEILKLNIFKRTIDSLADNLLQSGDLKLNKNRIESIITCTGFKAYIDSFVK